MVIRTVGDIAVGEEMVAEIEAHRSLPPGTVKSRTRTGLVHLRSTVCSQIPNGPVIHCVQRPDIGHTTSRRSHLWTSRHEEDRAE